jgi:hypothetical protein
MKEKTCCCDFCGHYNSFKTDPKKDFYRCHAGCCPGLAETEEQRSQWYLIQLELQNKNKVELKDNGIINNFKKYFKNFIWKD